MMRLYTRYFGHVNESQASQWIMDLWNKGLSKKHVEPGIPGGRAWIELYSMDIFMLIYLCNTVG